MSKKKALEERVSLFDKYVLKNQQVQEISTLFNETSDEKTREEFLIEYYNLLAETNDLFFELKNLFLDSSKDKSVQYRPCKVLENKSSFGACFIGFTLTFLTNFEIVRETSEIEKLGEYICVLRFFINKSTFSCRFFSTLFKAQKETF
jgi:hypothetical protein